MAQKCVHKGCGKTFTDLDEPCVYHPGPPQFHEGQKGVRAPYLEQLLILRRSLTISRMDVLQASRSDVRRVPFHSPMHDRQTLYR